MKKAILTVVLMAAASCSSGGALDEVVATNMSKLDGSLVLLDVNSEKEIIHNTAMANNGTTPCSTFKIWNALIGIENKVIQSENDLFYKWDGMQRLYPEWNRNLTLREAFAVSCVPAFQDLANKIGRNHMQAWIDKIGYGDRNISSGLDVFWLPVKNKKSILITPREQALLIKRLVMEQLPFSATSTGMLKKIMLSVKTKNGELYGKTGTGKNIDGVENNNIGWFVGYVTGGNGGYAFACLLQGKEITGKSAKAVVEKIFTEYGLL